MQIWLDDIHPPPSCDWVWCRNAYDVVSLLNTSSVTSISLDHDLGDDERRGTGADVAEWIEMKVYTDPSYTPPKYIGLHSDNAVGVQNMKVAIERVVHRAALNGHRVAMAIGRRKLGNGHTASAPH